jgi:GMP synthase-like glutamine amidotransferase
MARNLRFAILDCEDSEKWRGYTESLWCKAMRVRAEDTVEVFQCFASNWPDPAKVDELFDVVIIGGSHYSAYQDLPWINELESALRAYMQCSQVRIIACCFGHQLLCKALGGVVGRYFR